MQCLAGPVFVVMNVPCFDIVPSIAPVYIVISSVLIGQQVLTTRM